jgi:hypothetical protein
LGLEPSIATLVMLLLLELVVRTAIKLHDDLGLTQTKSPT